MGCVHKSWGVRPAWNNIVLKFYKFSFVFYYYYYIYFFTEILQVVILGKTSKSLQSEKMKSKRAKMRKNIRQMSVNQMLRSSMFSFVENGHIVNKIRYLYTWTDSIGLLKMLRCARLHLSTSLIIPKLTLDFVNFSDHIPSQPTLEA